MLAFSVYYWVLGELAFVPDRWQEKGICIGGGSWFMWWTTTALLEVLGVLVDSSPCQQQMSVLSDSLPWQLGHIAPHHINILGYNPQWNVLPPNIPHIVPISCKLSRIPCSVSKQRSNSQFMLTCWSKEGMVWEWSGVKGYVEVCSVSMCHLHLKMCVLVPMRHRWLDIPAIWQNIDNLVLFSCDLGLFPCRRPLRLPLTLEVASQSSLHRYHSPCMVIVMQHGRRHGFAKLLEVATCK